MIFAQLKWIRLVLLPLAFLLPFGSAIATPNSQAASTPEQAVSTLVLPLYDPSASNNACNALGGKLDGCPITERLKARLQSARENGNIVSRSQSPPRTVAVSVLDNSRQVAHVLTRWDVGIGYYSITFVAVKQSDGWLVDDSFCTDHPETSIFNPPTGPCTVDRSTSTGSPTSVPLPGIPNTGASAGQIDTFLWLALGAILVAGGIFLGVGFRRGRDGPIPPRTR